MSLLLAACGARSDLEHPAPTDAAVPAPDAGGVCSLVCGGAICKVLTDEVIAPAFANNDTATITLDASGTPAVLVEEPTPAYRGQIARRTAGGWSITELPAPLATGALAIGATGSLAAVAYDGAFASSLLIETGSALAVVAAVPTDETISSPNVVRDASGTLHILADGNTGRSPAPPTYFTYDGAFHVHDVGARKGNTAGGKLALSAAGVPWVSWYETTGSGTAPHVLRVWRGDTSAVETPTTSVGGGPTAIGFTRVGGAESAMILANDPAGAQLAAYTRAADGTWTRSVVVGDAGIPGCDSVCAVELRSVVILPSSDGARVLVAATTRAKDGSRTTHLAISPVDRAIATSDFVLTHANAEIQGARAIVDACGQVHVAYVEYDAIAGTASARYALLGAR
jgi:hypothetical protein